MLDDFCPSKVTTASRKRFRGSIAIAALVYGTAAAAVVAATATARKVMEEELTQVEFAPPPEPEPAPPPVEAAAPQRTARPKVKRQEIAPPDTISDEKLKESNKALAETGEGGPTDGFLDGVEGGTGTAAVPPPPPPPAPVKIEPLIVPVERPGNDRPKYSAGARRKGIEGVVVVSFEVQEDGSVRSPQIISGPEEPRSTVLETALRWRFQPARRGGKPIKHRMKKSVVFRLEDA